MVRRRIGRNVSGSRTLAREYMTWPARSARVACVDDCTQCPNLSSCAACAAATGACATCDTGHRGIRLAIYHGRRNARTL